MITVNLDIGDFTFWYDNDGKLWMAHESGEGMQMNKETEAKLNQLLADFWEENF